MCPLMDIRYRCFYSVSQIYNLLDLYSQCHKLFILFYRLYRSVIIFITEIFFSVEKWVVIRVEKSIQKMYFYK